MDLPTLIDLAADSVGSKGKLAETMGKSRSRVSEWVSGKQKPDAHEIAFMAELAKLPVLQTVAEIESQLDSRYAEVWRNALGKLTAAGVAASLVGALALSPDDANSRNLHAVKDSYAQKPTLYIMSTSVWRRLKQTAKGFVGHLGTYAQRLKRSLIASKARTALPMTLAC